MKIHEYENPSGSQDSIRPGKIDCKPLGNSQRFPGLPEFLQPDRYPALSAFICILAQLFKRILYLIIPDI